MRIIFVLALLALAVALPAGGFDLGNRAPTKPTGSQQAPPPDPEIIRQGGDTLLDAILIPGTPYDVTGTTVGYTDDYDEACPYSNSTSPDVVYRFTPSNANVFDFDLWGSSYDTKIYIYRENMTLVACNDDYYSDYVSKIEAVPLERGVKYFVVIDGYGGEAGDYRLQVWEYCPCEISCNQTNTQDENEPPLVDGYVDQFNGGCNSEEYGTPFQTIGNANFCGVSGWYLDGGVESRDTDWFRLYVPPDGYVEITGDAEMETFMFELAPQDCDEVAVVQSVTIGPCAEATMIIPGEVGNEVWFWVGSTTFTNPGGGDDEYIYFLRTNLLWHQPVATEFRDWTSVKSLFR